MTAVRQKLSQIDQVNLEEHISRWVEQDPTRKLYMRPFRISEDELLDEKGYNDNDDDDDDDDVNIELLQKVTTKNTLAKKNKFLYVHQDEWQCKLLVKYGNNVSLMDATYKTTKYEVVHTK